MSIILIVDDNPLMRDPIAQTLRSAGYETLCAENGAAAIDLLRMLPVDLIVLDLFMPVMGGTEFLAAIRAKTETASIPVILLSASEDSEELQVAEKHGVQASLTKTHFKLRELVALVRRELAATVGKSKRAG
jgi:CheY-like chemotaxis protein